MTNPPTVTRTITLSEHQWARLQIEAARHGLSPSGFSSWVLDLGLAALTDYEEMRSVERVLAAYRQSKRQDDRDKASSVTTT